MSLNTKWHEEVTKLHEGKEITMKFDELSNQVIGCAIEVHKHLGPGLLESVYKHCFAYELRTAQIPFAMEPSVPIQYKNDVTLDCGFRADFIIAEKLVVELKSVDQVAPIHTAQILTHMKLARLSVGLLLNFNVTVLKNGIKRYVL